ncbi:hypothetical protein [Streptococcus minor]|uniref:hypothetical protein n=1 Tax=Streptococcus minor TaxID=229549 RepID=UPI0003672650|nr:hypothetical protein [Streptococcus minor]
MEEKKKRKGYASKEAQAAADKRYYHASEENRQKRLYLQARSTARSFIRKRATLADLEELESLITKEKKKF